MSQNTPKTKRLFVGGLFNEVTPEDLKQRFAKYGIVKSVDLKTKKNSFGDIVKTFAFIDFDSTPAKLKQCIDVFNKAKWKGKELKIQPAEDSFLDKLAKERQTQSVVKLWSQEQSKMSDTEEPHRAIQQLKVKGPPGTAIEGKEGWVIGKYSQPVPVLRVKQADGKKTVIFDPSKNCHGLKRFDKDDDVPKVSLDQLTWHLEEKRLPPRAVIPKPSKRKNIKATKKIMFNDSNSASGSEIEFDETVKRSNSFLDMSARQMDDSDNESKGSCDTDEIVRRAKSGKLSQYKDEKKHEVKNSSPISNQKSVTNSLAKIQPSMKYPRDIVAKELLFSEFSDGVSSSSDADRGMESENENIEDVFDLLESGQIEKLLNTSQSQPSKSKMEKLTTVKIVPESAKQLTRKRKKCQSESPTLLLTESSVSLESTEAPRKRKISNSELERKLATAGTTEKISLKEGSTSSASVISEKSKRRKISPLSSENQSPSTSLAKTLESTDVRSSKTSATTEKSKKRKRSDLEEEEDQTSETNRLELIQSTGVASKSLKHNETKDTAKPTDTKMQRVNFTKDPELNTEVVEKKVSVDVPGKKIPVAEQKKSLETLQSVLPIKAAQPMGFRDFQSFRYDPSAADHDRFEIHDGSKQSQQPVQVKKTEKETQKLPCTEVKRFAEVDASVVDVFKAPVDAPFLLGALFGPEESSDEEAESKSVLANWKKKPKTVVDNENDERYENKAESKSRTSKKIEDGFFYHAEDARLKASKFCREKSLEELRAEWQEKRPHFVESYRMKKKKPLRSHGNVTRPNVKPHGKPTFFKGKPRGNVFKKNRSHVKH